jgi:hypothetical protein
MKLTTVEVSAREYWELKMALIRVEAEMSEWDNVIDVLSRELLPASAYDGKREYVLVANCDAYSVLIRKVVNSIGDAAFMVIDRDDNRRVEWVDHSDNPETDAAALYEALGKFC